MNRLPIALGCLLLAGACASGSSADPTTPATTPSPTTATSAEPTTTTTPVPGGVPGVTLPDVDVDDAGEALRSIMAFVDDLSRDPQPDLLVNYYDPGCATYDIVFDNFSRLADNEWQWAVLEPTEITSLLPVIQTDTEAQLIATYTVAADELMDVSGTVVRREPAQTYEQGITLKRSTEYGWRICDSVEVIDP